MAVARSVAVAFLLVGFTLTPGCINALCGKTGYAAWPEPGIWEKMPPVRGEGIDVGGVALTYYVAPAGPAAGQPIIGGLAPDHLRFVVEEKNDMISFHIGRQVFELSNEAAADKVEETFARLGLEVRPPQNVTWYWNEPSAC